MTTSLRPLIIEDLKLIQTWENLEELWSFSEQVGPFSEADIASFVARCLNEEDSEIERLIITSNEIPIGAVDLFDYDQFNQTCGLGIFITHEKDRLQGHATRALSQTLEILKGRQCKLIRAIIYQDNPGSIRVFEKANFLKAGSFIYKGKLANHYYREITT